MYSQQWGELRELARFIGEDNPQVGRMLRLARMHPTHATTAIRSLRAMAEREGIDIGNPPLFVPQAIRGDPRGLHIGTQIISGSPAGELLIPFDEMFSSHTLIVAGTSWGKSTLLEYMLRQCVQQGLRFVLCDSEGEHWRLVDGESVWGFRVPEDDRDNPLAPTKGVSIDRWLAGLKRIIGEVFWCRAGMLNLFDSAMRNLYGSMSAAAPDRFPTLADLKVLLDRMRYRAGSRHALYHESLLDRVNSLLDNLGDMVRCHDGYSMEELSNRSIVWDVSALPQDMLFFTLYLKLIRMFRFRELQLEEEGGQAGNDCLDLFVLEESHRLTSKVLERRPEYGDPLAFEVARVARKRGMKLIYIDQIFAMPPPISGNIANRFIGCVHDPYSLGLLSRTLGWNAEQLDYVRRMPQRHWIVQTPRIRDGVVVRVPELR